MKPQPLFRLGGQSSLMVETYEGFVNLYTEKFTLE